MTRTFVAAALTAASLFAAMPAAAAPAPEKSKAFLLFVPVGDLDLARSADQRTLSHRLNAAAKDVCGTPDTPELRKWMDVRKCRATILRAGDSRVEQAAAGQRAQAVALASR